MSGRDTSEGLPYPKLRGVADAALAYRAASIKESGQSVAFERLERALVKWLGYVPCRLCGLAKPVWSRLCKPCYVEEFGEEQQDPCDHGNDPNHVPCEECCDGQR